MATRNRRNEWHQVHGRWTRSLGERGMRVRIFEKRRNGTFCRTTWGPGRGRRAVLEARSAGGTVRWSAQHRPLDRRERRLSEQRKYRSWTAQQKIEIVLAGLRGDRSVAEVCREHQISDNRFYSWRDKLL